MVKTTLETADYATPALANEKKAVWGALAMVCLLCVGTFLVASTVTEHQDRMTELVSVSGPVRIGDKIALKNAYNNYLLTMPDGSMKAMGAEHHWNEYEVLAAPNTEADEGSPVEYGQKIVLRSIGNKMYVTAKSNGLLTAREYHGSHLGNVFSFGGGRGAVSIGDHVHIKAMMGYVTAVAAHVRGDSVDANDLQTFKIESPTQLSGYMARTGLSYGDIVTLRNRANEYLSADPRNGWVYLRPENSEIDRWAVLSPADSQGKVRYGDVVYFKSYATGNFLACNLGHGLTANRKGPATFSEIKIVGSNGIVHRGDDLGLWCGSGYVSSDIPGGGVSKANQVHWSAEAQFEISW
eukprot:JP446269.1.p2 GENE.JP446269.1~~JP446269.1.p2  ORF type:complete len:364 (+),score=123.62 JP446269.1:39-1094(+)